MATPEVRSAALREAITDELPVVIHDPLTAEVPVVGAGAGPGRPWYRRRRPVVILVVVVLLAAGAGIGIWLGTGGSSLPPVEVTTQTVAVTTGTMQQTVAATGTIAPGQQANVNFAVSGRVNAVNVAAGQKVMAGQTLATVDSTALQAQYDSASATLSAAQAKLTADQANGASSSQLLSDQASVTSAQSSLSTAQNNLNAANLTAPISGTVASVSLTVGQQVSGSGGSSPSGSGSSGSGGGGSGGNGSGGSGSGGSGSGSAASGSGGSGSSGSGNNGSSNSSGSGQVVIINTASFLVNATVDDTEVGQIQNGDQAVITPSGGSTTIYGTVASVGMIASNTSGVASFPVVVNVTGTPSGLYAGDSANVSIIVKQLNNVVQVPTAALSFSGGQTTVTLVQNGQHITRAVTTGIQANGETQITNGLAAGDKVLERVVKFNGTPGGLGGRGFGGAGFGSSGFGGGPGGGFTRRIGGGSFTGGGGFNGGA